MQKLIRILSLGAGVQSSTVALMIARGDLPPVDCAVFADTGSEPARVYQWLDWLEKQLPFPIIRARREGQTLGEMMIDIAHNPVTRTAMAPWYVTGEKGSVLPRQCSKEFKTRVVNREVRKMLGLARKQQGPKELACEMLLGISLDEMERMKENELKYVKNVFPLVDLRITRNDCLRWMEARQYPTPPKSSCIFCPYRRNHQWRDMRDNAPDDWAKAVEFDKAIRPGFHGMEGQAFVHQQRVPLEEVDLSTAEDRGQGNLFLEECEGMCGV
jgi:hypothetical protein